VGVIAVHPFGIPAPLQALTALCEARGWWLVEDAACALGTAVTVASGPAAEPGRRWADGRWPICLSFHPRKTITTGEGGAVVSDDAALAARVRTLRNQGVDDAIAGFDRFAAAGFNYRMSDVHAAIGVVQLGRLDGIVAARRRIAGWYREALAPLARRGLVRWPRGYDAPELAMQSLVVEVTGGAGRDEVMAGLAARGIGSTLGGYALATQPYYRRRYGRDPERTPVAARLYRRSLTLPLTEAMSRDDVAGVCAALGEVIEEVA
jgi:dTDP-4-amino-4,6-dideoxygalactose transaminase